MRLFFKRIPQEVTSEELDAFRMTKDTYIQQFYAPTPPSSEISDEANAVLQHPQKDLLNASYGTEPVQTEQNIPQPQDPQKDLLNASYGTEPVQTEQDIPQPQAQQTAVNTDHQNEMTQPQSQQFMVQNNFADSGPNLQHQQVHLSYETNGPKIHDHKDNTSHANEELQYSQQTDLISPGNGVLHHQPHQQIVPINCRIAEPQSPKLKQNIQINEGNEVPQNQQPLTLISLEQPKHLIIHNNDGNEVPLTQPH